MPSEHLYDYITSMELQRANNEAAEGGGSGGSGGTGSSSSSSTDPANQDLYTQLAQKEQDLLLAAQLGKALLEKNEELSMLNEKMAEDYSKQLEVSRLFHPLPPPPSLPPSLPPTLQTLSRVSKSPEALTHHPTRVSSPTNSPRDEMKRVATSFGNVVDSNKNTDIVFKSRRIKSVKLPFSKLVIWDSGSRVY